MNHPRFMLLPFICVEESDAKCGHSPNDDGDDNYTLGMLNSLLSPVEATYQRPRTCYHEKIQPRVSDRQLPYRSWNTPA